MVGFAQVLRRGIAAGAAAGLAAAVVLWLVVEPVIRRALEIEDARIAHAVGPHTGGQSAVVHLPLHGGEEPLVSRAVQVAGGALTSVLVGIAFGVIFAVVFAKTRERLTGTGDFTRSTVLAAVAFASVSLLPALRLPANPPAVGDPATVGRRTMLYGVTLLSGVALALAVPAVDRWLSRRGVERSRRLALDVAAAVAGVVLVFVLVPGSPDAVPADVPPTLLWDFRVASLAQLATTWLVLGVTFGLLMERAAERTGDRARVATPAPA